MSWQRTSLIASVMTAAVMVATAEGQIRADPDMLALVPPELLTEGK